MNKENKTVKTSTTKTGQPRRVARLGALAAAAAMFGALLGMSATAHATQATTRTQTAGETILGIGDGGTTTTASNSDMDPYWGNLNPQNLPRTLGSDITSDPYWDSSVYDSTYGYLHVNVRDYWEDIPRAQGYRVLRWADEEHNSAAGGWLGVRFEQVGNKYRTTPIRNLYWTYVSFGLGCTAQESKVGWNQYRGEYTCLPNRDWLLANRPGYAQQKADCVNGKIPVGSDETWTGSKNVLEPLWNDDTKQWKNICGSGYVTDGDVYGQRIIYPSYEPPAVRAGCGAWERDGLSTENSPLCKYEFYAWADNDFHKGEDGYFPPPGTGGGGGADSYTATVERTVTTEETVTLDASVKSTGSAVRGEVKKTVTKTVNGKRYTATGVGYLVTKATASGYASSTKTLRVSTTSSGSCTKPTKAEAEQCAADQAEALARQVNASKLEDAKDDFQRQVKQDAIADGKSKADAAAKSAPITSTVKSKAAEDAKRDAERKIKQMSS